MRKLNVNMTMPRPLKSVPQAKRVAPPTVPDVYRHSAGSNYDSIRYSTTSSSSSSGSAASCVEAGGFNQPRETPAALMKDEIIEYGNSGSNNQTNIIGGGSTTGTSCLSCPTGIGTTGSSGPNNTVVGGSGGTGNILPAGNNISSRNSNNNNCSNLVVVNPCTITPNNLGGGGGGVIGGGVVAPSGGVVVGGVISNVAGSGGTGGGSGGVILPTGIGGNNFPFSANIYARAAGEPLTHKTAVYYHQQLALQEDQGIDLTQSPGRDSPGSSSGSAGSGSRHSTASLDSGRASSYITGGASTSTRGALSSPRCSISSWSIGSVDRMSQRSDHDIIADWLMDVKLEEYAQLFIAAGYDLPTISRMTPEDLTAIGIKNPQHRERIKQHIDNLQVPDCLPNFVPGSIEEWLRLLRLDEYIQPLLDQNYRTVRDVIQVTWEDLEDIGIVKLGHQKKILLAIKRVKDIISGKWSLRSGNYHHQVWRRSYDDGDITPTNEITLDMNESGGTLPRKRNNSSGRGQIYQDKICNAAAAAAANAASMIPPSHIINTLDYYVPESAIMAANVRCVTCSPLSCKRQIPPDPPRRRCSVRNTKSLSLQESPNPCYNTATSGVAGGGGRTFIHYDQLSSSEAAGTIGVGGGNNTVRSTTHQYIPSPPPPPAPQNQHIYVNFTEHQQQTHQTTVEVHCDSKTFEGKSNSSIDSIDTIPFANENTGTIKQKLLNRQEISSSLSLSSSSSSSSANTVANIAQSFHSLKTSGSLHDGASLLSSGGGTGSGHTTPPSPSISSPTASSAPSSASLKIPLNLDTSTHSPSIRYYHHIPSLHSQHHPNNINNNNNNNNNYNNHHLHYHQQQQQNNELIDDVTTCISAAGIIVGGDNGAVNSNNLNAGINMMNLSSSSSIGNSSGIIGGSGCINNSATASNILLDYHHHHQQQQQQQQQQHSVTSGVAGLSVEDSSNVLNDIGNMLANLTDELDAMLEEEKRVGINDSE